MKADEFLGKAQALMIERGKQYDQPNGERSMGKTIRAFNAITGRDLTEAEGWLLLQVLKDVRQWQNPDKYHADSAEDSVTYAALKAEALASSSPEIDFLGAPSHATHRLASNIGYGFVWAFDDAGTMRDCHTQYVIDMDQFTVAATRIK